MRMLQYLTIRRVECCHDSFELGQVFHGLYNDVNWHICDVSDDFAVFKSTVPTIWITK